MEDADVTICDIFLFKVRRTTIKSLKHKNPENILDAVAHCLDVEQEDRDKLLLYTLDSRNGGLHSVTRYNDLLDLLDDRDFTGNITFFAVNLFKLGLARINMDSLAESNSNTQMIQIEEWHDALKLFNEFKDHIANSNKEFCQVVKRCLKNTYIDKNMFTYVENHQKLIEPPNLLDLGNVNILDNLSSIVDNFRSVGEYSTVQVCEILKGARTKFEFANVLKRGETKTITIGHGENTENITIHSSVFDYIIGGAGFGQGLAPELGKLEKLGKGGFGAAYKFTPNYHDDLKNVVIKSTCKLDGDNPKPAWHREVKHTRELCHPNVIKYYGEPIIYNGNVYNVIEYGGQSIVKRYCTTKMMPEQEIKKAMLHIASGVDYLHSEGICGDYVVHRDIRCDNITVTDDGVYKIIDFGISSKTTVENSRFESETHWGHPFWKSPEYCRYMTVQWDHERNPDVTPSADVIPPGRKSDVWSFGVLTLEMLSFPKQPYYFSLKRYDKRFSIIAYIHDLAEGKIILKNYIKNEWPDQIKDVLEKCFEIDEQTRLDSKELKALCENFSN